VESHPIDFSFKSADKTWKIYSKAKKIRMNISGKPTPFKKIFRKGGKEREREREKKKERENVRLVWQSPQRGYRRRDRGFG
jgi:hypothetical protein